jgi:biotin carboxyl carrier protein
VRYAVTINGRELEITLDGPVVRIGELEADAHLVDIVGIPLRMVTIAGRVHRVLARRRPAAGQYTIDLDGYRFEVEALDERTQAIRRLAESAVRPTAPASVLAPMPGLVVRVLVQPGARVQAGQAVVVIEAMKMENELRASTAGIVRSVPVMPGSAVEKGAVLVEFESAQ